MWFAILGPVELSADGMPVPLGGPKQRALLALLLLHSNQVVSRDRLVDALWRDSPPPSASDSLDAYVYRLRRLAGQDRIARRANGYVLSVRAGELDADCFDQLVGVARQQGEAGDHHGAAESLSEALALWRGPALADVAGEPFASGRARSLDQARLEALESRIEAELDAGRGGALVPELEQLVSAHPLRERLTAALMLALYRAGRQADALAAFQQARSRLVEDLGLEPGHDLRELEGRILRHDPSLAAPRLFPRPDRWARWHRYLAGAAMALALVLIAGAVVERAVARTPPAGLDGANGLVAISTATRRLIAATPLRGAPEAESNGAGSVWAAQPGDGVISRIQPGSGTEVDQILLSGEPSSIVSGGGAIWVASSVGATVTRIDPVTESVTQTIRLPGTSPAAMAVGAGHLWVADSGARELFEVDLATGHIDEAIHLDVQPSAVIAASRAIWVAGYNDATVARIDPATGHMTGSVHVGTGPVGLATEGGSLWVANSLDASVSRIDPATMKMTATIAVRSGPCAVVAARGEVWVANQYSDSVSAINPSNDAVVSSVAVGGPPTSLAVSQGKLWVGVAASGRSHRGGTLTIATITGYGFGAPATSSTVDPAIYFAATVPQFIGLAYDSLVTFDKSPGTAGTRLVPDLAIAVPTPTQGGRAYVFRLRPGIRYSDGQPLHASDFRRAIERDFRVGSPGATYFAGLRGAAACLKDPATCNLSQGIVTDNRTGVVIMRLTRPDPDLLFDLTVEGFSAPIPPGTPDHETGSRTVPGTGPYKIVEVGRDEVRFVRNPFFHEWSHAAQPAGNPNAIIWKAAPSTSAAVLDVEHGRADWFAGLIPGGLYRQLALAEPDQLHSSPAFIVEFGTLNAHLAPFNDLRVRQALNYAVDRKKIARMYGGPSFATPTCQPLTPGMPGYVRYCPYTLSPRRDGAWAAPDLGKARRLVSESGTRGETIIIHGDSDEPFIPRGIPAYMATVLRSLGYHVRLELQPTAQISVAARRHFQITFDGDWLADFPDPSSYLPQFFACGGGSGSGYFCSRRLDREMTRAERLEMARPAAATALWTSVDHQLTNAAAWVPTVNERQVDFVSRRLRNYEYSGQFQFLPDQAWLG
jgi:YVTN family beta-propeller protein